MKIAFLCFVEVLGMLNGKFSFPTGAKYCLSLIIALNLLATNAVNAAPQMKQLGLRLACIRSTRSFAVINTRTGANVHVASKRSELKKQLSAKQRKVKRLSASKGAPIRNDISKIKSTLNNIRKCTRGAFAKELPRTAAADLCQGDRFLWNVIPAPNGKGQDTDTSKAPHVRRGRVELINMHWAGALPDVVVNDAAARDRLKWLGVPFALTSGGTKLVVNGGTPINGDLNFHVARLTAHIQAAIPNANFNGYIVPDFEVWNIPWEWNVPEFQNLARQQVAAANPALNPSQLEIRTKQLWQERATAFYLATQRTIQRLRPSAKVGWYDSFQRVYWKGYASPHGDTLRAMNDVTIPLHQEADFVIADIYQFYSTAVNSSGVPIKAPAPKNADTYFEMNRAYVAENVREAQRLARIAGGKPVMAYTWPRYHENGSNSPRGLQMVAPTELFLQLVYPLLLGVNHITIWGDEWRSFNNSRIGKLQPYFDRTMAPMIEDYCRGDLTQYQKLVTAAGL